MSCQPKVQDDLNCYNKKTTLTWKSGKCGKEGMGRSGVEDHWSYESNNEK